MPHVPRRVLALEAHDVASQCSCGRGSPRHHRCGPSGASRARDVLVGGTITCRATSWITPGLRRAALHALQLEARPCTLSGARSNTSRISACGPSAPPTSPGDVPVDVDQLWLSPSAGKCKSSSKAIQHRGRSATSRQQDFGPSLGGYSRRRGAAHSLLRLRGPRLGRKRKASYPTCSSCPLKPNTAGSSASAGASVADRHVPQIQRPTNSTARFVDTLSLFVTMS